MPQLIMRDEVYAIVGAAMEVHRQKGCGFSEPVYQECLEIELAMRNISAVSQKETLITYKGRTLKRSYIADFVAYDKVIVELKALDKLSSREESQVLNYLKSSSLTLGLLINSGAPSLEWKRVVLTGAAELVDLQEGKIRAN